MFKVYLRFGIWIAVILIAYFLLLKLVGLHRYPVLSAVNGLIYGAGIYMAIKAYNAKKTNFKYEKSFEVGFLTGAIATILFTGFMAVFMYQLDSEFAVNILEKWGEEYARGTLILLASIGLMGFATTLVLTLSFMQLLKKSWNTTDGKRNTL